MPSVSLLDLENLWTPFREDTSRTAGVLPFHEQYPALLKNSETLAWYRPVT
jgi:hypothetical protein